MESGQAPSISGLVTAQRLVLAVGERAAAVVRRGRGKQIWTDILPTAAETKFSLDSLRKVAVLAYKAAWLPMIHSGSFSFFSHLDGGCTASNQ